MKQSIENTTVRGMTVLVRTDYNIPLKDGKITEDLRIRESLPTLELLIKKGARRIVVMSHLGRPEGKKVSELSLAPVAERLKELLPERKVFFIRDVAGPDVEEAVEKLPAGGILLLENLRFYPGEEANSAEFAKQIVDSTHADLFVQDGFAVVHRAHASTSAITREIPSVAGLLLEKEIKGLSALIDSPKTPFLVIIGGAKVEDKQPLIDKFARIAQNIAVGGKIAADGYTTALSNIYVAEDFLGAEKRDIGPKSTAKIVDLVKNAKTVLWNGTMGLTEEEEYAKGSTTIAEAISEKTETDENFTSVICGGDTTGFVENLPNLHFSLISTGGGAALEYLLGNDLPGISSLDDAE